MLVPISVTVWHNLLDKYNINTHHSKNFILPIIHSLAQCSCDWLREQ